MRRIWGNDRAATDPLLVIAAIAVSLVLLVGGTFTVRGLIANAHRVNAVNDLDRVATSEAAAAADTAGAFFDYSSDNPAAVAPVGFTVTNGSTVTARSCTTGWMAVAVAADGRKWVRTSASPATAEAPASSMKLPDCFTSNDLQRFLAAPGLPAPATAQSVVLAGNATAGYQDGFGDQARFSGLHGLNADPNGTIYAADCGNKAVRKVTTGGVVTTIASSTGVNPAGDPVPILPSGACVRGTAASTDHVYAAQAAWTLSDISGGTIRPITLTNVPTSTTGLQRMELLPNGDILAGVYNAVVTINPTTGRVTVIAGATDNTAGCTPGTGGAARFTAITHAVQAPNGNIYAADTGCRVIWQITPAGTATIYAGSTTVTGSADGPIASARFANPASLAIATDGTFYISDIADRTIRRISTTGTVTTVFSGTDNQGKLVRASAITLNPATGDLIASNEDANANSVNVISTH
ncbi:hypothetical protein [Curtobacterium sp. MCSS17_016]|uniref:hypothetical protein n=1 Tax=Curtobacterium sp. MCSS17_016 TaxID=2175644 RepID=UPI0011B7CD93|nr:hypothetical protein [Curtobacterium sp. MCSS17_016]WIE81421.1 hypothetical protein DEJ19_019490 [Curtobacterium sp. MCSS17_016]